MLNMQMQVPFANLIQHNKIKVVCIERMLAIRTVSVPNYEDHRNP